MFNMCGGYTGTPVQTTISSNSDPLTDNNTSFFSASSQESSTTCGDPQTDVNVLPSRAIQYLLSVDPKTLRPRQKNSKTHAREKKVGLSAKMSREMDFRDGFLVQKELPTTITIEHESYSGTGC